MTIHAMKAWVEPGNEYTIVTIQAMKAWVEPGNEYTIVTIHVMKARQSLTMKLVSVYRMGGKFGGNLIWRISLQFHLADYNLAVLFFVSNDVIRNCHATYT